MPFTPLISRVTLLARPTSVWIRMNALTTSTSSIRVSGHRTSRPRPGANRRPPERSGHAPQDPDEQRAALAKRMAQSGVGEPEPLVEAGRAVVGLGHAEHHRPRAP